MRVIDPGHVFGLAELDGGIEQHVTFVKRVGDRFPGNAGSAHPGVTTQEVLRALISRTKYVDGQKHHRANDAVLSHLRAVLTALEVRAHEERGVNFWSLPAPGLYIENIEDLPTCLTCGHVLCTIHGGG